MERPLQKDEQRLKRVLRSLMVKPVLHMEVRVSTVARTSGYVHGSDWADSHPQKKTSTERLRNRKTTRSITSMRRLDIGTCSKQLPKSVTICKDAMPRGTQESLPSSPKKATHNPCLSSTGSRQIKGIVRKCVHAGRRPSSTQRTRGGRSMSRRRSRSHRQQTDGN